MTRNILLSFSFSILLACGAQTAAVDTPTPSTRDIVRDIERIGLEKDKYERRELSNEMATDISKVWKAGNVNGLYDGIVDKLILLLGDNDDFVRGSAAAAVGYFGPRADRAIPALKHAIELAQKEQSDSREVFTSGVSSIAIIQVALERIRGVPEKEIFPASSQPNP